MKHKNEIVLKERGNTLTIYEKRGGTLAPVMRVIAGAVTQAQMRYFEANLKGRIKQVEADLILKYFYGIDIN